MEIDVFHNVRWARYKGAVFSQLYSLASTRNIRLRIFQIADTELDRQGLSDVDLRFHQYPHDLLFPGAYESVPLVKRVVRLALVVNKSRASVLVLPGYHRPEYWAMLVVARIRGIKCAVFCDSTAFDNPRSVAKAFLKRLFFANCRGFFCYGTRSKEYLGSFGVPSERIYTRVQAAALPPSYDAETAIAARCRLAASTVTPVFLYVGRLSVEKGLKDLLAAFGVVLWQFPQARLVLVGSGPQEQELRALATSLGVGDSVTFAGPKSIDELSDYYASATCLVLPSISEPWGLVANEALSFGCPAIVSDRCGCAPDLIVHGENGVVFRAGDVNELAAVLSAAPRMFENQAMSSRRCIASISRYSPEMAARQMLEGCKKIFDR